MSDPTSSILIIKPSSLGDVVHTLPPVALVKKRWPEARVRWLINPEWAPLLEDNPYVDEAIIFPRQELRGVRGILGRTMRVEKTLPKEAVVLLATFDEGASQVGTDHAVGRR